VVAAVAGAASVWAYPRLPPTVATHWNFRGEPNGYSSRLLAAVLLPALIIGFTLLVQVLPKIDPKGANYQKFSRVFWLLMNGIIAFFGVLHLVVLANGIGAPVNMGRVLTIGIGVLFVLIGNFLGQVEPNWFLGIRTPWTLSSDTVWRKTHRTAAWLFVLGGVLFAATTFVRPSAAVVIGVTTLIVVAVIPIVQSYVLWNRERSK
jgi:uncharacterized membrane protein